MYTLNKLSFLITLVLSNIKGCQGFVLCLWLNSSLKRIVTGLEINDPYSSFSSYCLRTRFLGIMAAFDITIVSDSSIIIVMKLRFCPWMPRARLDL